MSEDALLAYVAASLARYKVPARIEFVDDFPRVSTGKVMRRELRQRVLAPGSGQEMDLGAGQVDRCRQQGHTGCLH